MSRPLESLSLCSPHKAKLARAGYETVDDMKYVRVAELSRELSIPLAEAVEIMKVVTGKESSGPTHSPSLVNTSFDHNQGKTALELLQTEQTQNHIVTFSARIDTMLGGGVPVGKITEFCGTPGIGKTQLCIQLAVDATIPVPFGGCGSEAIYIDTEGSFITERVVQIANATVRHIQAVADSTGDQALKDEASQYTLETILKRIHYYRCHSYIQLIALSNILHQTVAQCGNKVCLVVVDSIASPFRQGFKDSGQRNRLLSGLAQNFIKLATAYDLAVILTNHMTTRVHGNSSSQLIPALGESWGHASTIRIILYWEGTDRLALLYKSPSHCETVVPYLITKDGIRDVLEGSDSNGLKPSQFTVTPSQELEDELVLEEEDPCHLDSLIQQVPEDWKNDSHLVSSTTDKDNKTEKPPCKRLRYGDS